MPWNGSGTFTRDQNFVNDAAAGPPDHFISADKVDDEFDNYKAGLENCLTRDGQTSPSSSLPMGNYRHTGVGNAQARNEYLTAGQAQDQGVSYAAETGAADAYVVTLSPAPTAYVAGMRVSFKATNANTGASTLKLGSLTTKAIQFAGAALTAGMIPANGIVDVIYDGTQWQMVSVPLAAFVTLVGNQTVGGNKIFSGIVTIGGDPSNAAASDTLRLMNASGNSGMLISVNNTTSQSYLLFGDTDARARGGITYTHSTDLTTLLSSGSGRVFIGTGVYIGAPTGTDMGSGTLNATELYKNGVKASGAVIDRAYAQYTSASALATNLPFDDTTPGSGEGVQILSQSITPKANSHIIRARFSGFGATAGTQISYALFRGTTCIQVGSTRQVASGNCVPLVLEFEDSPGTTSSTTYSIRVGGDSGNAYVNADNSGNRKFNGVAKATLVLEEVVA